MTDILFNDCLDILKEIHEKNDGLRVGEVIQGSVDIIGRTNMNLFDISTKELKKLLIAYKEKMK